MTKYSLLWLRKQQKRNNIVLWVTNRNGKISLIWSYIQMLERTNSRCYNWTHIADKGCLP